MSRKTTSQHNGRAKRFALRFPVYFRPPDSPTWLEGMTENISYTGVLFHSESPSLLEVESTVELRLQIAVAAQGQDPAEIRGKGVVVRLERKGVPEIPVVMAVAMRDCRIVRRPSVETGSVGSA